MSFEFRAAWRPPFFFSSRRSFCFAGIQIVKCGVSQRERPRLRGGTRAETSGADGPSGNALTRY